MKKNKGGRPRNHTFNMLCCKMVDLYDGVLSRKEMAELVACMLHFHTGISPSRFTHTVQRNWDQYIYEKKKAE